MSHLCLHCLVLTSHVSINGLLVVHMFLQHLFSLGHARRHGLAGGLGLAGVLLADSKVVLEGLDFIHSPLILVIKCQGRIIFLPLLFPLSFSLPLSFLFWWHVSSETNSFCLACLRPFVVSVA